MAPSICITFLLSSIYFLIIFFGDFYSQKKLVKLFNLYNSFTHGIIATLCSYIDICFIISNQSHLVEDNFLSNWHYISLFYFIYDTYWSFYDKNYIYVYHHFVCIGMILYSLFLQKYYNLLSLVLFLGECSGPMFNLLKIFKLKKYKTQLLFVIFTTVFIFIRFILTPFAIIYIYTDVNSFVDRCVFIFSGIALMIGSLFWVKGQYSYIKKRICHKLD